MKSLSGLMAILIAFLFVCPASAATLCKDVVRASYVEGLNEQMALKYPKVAVILQSPENFMENMRERFEVQKTLTPNDPYAFDYSDIALSLVREADGFLNTKTKELQKKAAQTKKTTEKDEYQAAILYLAELKAEGLFYLKSSKITYKQSLEYFYFFSRAIGHFDSREFNPIQKFMLQLDSRLEGYRQLSISDEYSLYKERNFTLFQPNTPSARPGARAAQKYFEEALFNKDFLGVIFVPTNEALDTDVLLRMLGHNIHMIGVTPEPILADGILRPSGLFWMHDVRHEADKFYMKKLMIRGYGLSKAQIHELQKKSDEWLWDFLKKKDAIQDEQLKRAVDVITFHYFHDFGHPLLPSMFLARNDRDYKKVLYGLLSLMAANGQKSGFKFGDISQATQWMNKFWLSHLSEERSILPESQNTGYLYHTIAIEDL